MTKFKPIRNLILTMCCKTFILCGLITSSSTLFGQNWNELSVLKSSVQEVNDNFGTVVAINQHYAIASSFASSSPGKWPVHVFKKNDNNTFSFVQGLKSSDANNPFIANSLAVSDSILVIGYTGPFLQAGSAIIFILNTEGEWIEKQRLIPSNGQGFEKFGSAVAISGTTIVVSSPERSIEYHEGMVYVFEQGEDGLWFEKQKLMASDYHRDDFFGSSITIQGDDLLVGAPYENENSFDAFNHGAAYYFHRNSEGLWEEKQKIISPNRKPNSTFGWSMDIFKDELIISAKMEEHYGAVYFFNKADDLWVFHQRIASPSENSYGQDVAMDNSLAVVSLGDHLAKYTFTYIKKADGTWEAAGKLYGPPFTNFEAEKFGHDIDLSGDFLVIGAPDANASIYSDYNPPRAGEAHVYRASAVPLPFSKTSWLDTKGRGSFLDLVDFDNDGDLDLFASVFGDQSFESYLYRLTENQYTPLDQHFPALEYNSASKWIDVNADDWLDLLITREVNFVPQAELYLNNQGLSFTGSNVSMSLMPEAWHGGFHFSDYDHDGDADLLVQTTQADSKQAAILTNDGKFNFTMNEIKFNGTLAGANPWFDYNNDGFQDFILSREISCNLHVLIIYRNTGTGTFESVATNIQILSPDILNVTGDMAWGDYDNDGDADLIWSGVNGCSTGDGSSDILLNDAGVFRSLNKPFRTLLSDSHLRLVDFNSDGTLDLLAYGDPLGSAKNEATFFINKNNTLSKLILYELPSSYQGGNVAIGDIERDGDVDVVIAGNVNFSSPQVFVYQNNSAEGAGLKNTPPTKPGSLQTQLNEDGTVDITWTVGNDDSTPIAALTYNVRLIRNDSILFNGYSLPNGNRQRFEPGNMGHSRKLTLQNLKNGLYRVLVQAIDNNYEGSAFTEAIEFSIGKITRITGEPIVTVFPNPVLQMVKIQSVDSDVRRIQIFDSAGKLVRLVHGSGNSEINLDLSDQSTGFYLLKVEHTNGITFHRLVKR